jgi:hypothetical protein
VDYFKDILDSEENVKWYDFNDKIISPLMDDDYKKQYGGEKVDETACIFK